MPGSIRPNGEDIELVAGGYRAVLTTVGAGIRELTFRGHQLVLPFAPEDIPPAFAGKTLVPWPNRVAGGRYSFDGKQYELPVNEGATGSALHGLAVWSAWRVAERTPNSVVLEHILHGEPGYPFQLLVTAAYTLNEESGLRMRLSAENRGSTAAPYGSGSHPYLTVDGADIAGLELRFGARFMLLTDEQLRPTELVPVPDTEFDFATPRLVGTQQLDHAFTGLPPGSWQVSLRHPALKLAAVAEAETGTAPWLQLYSGELRDRRGIAVEPMTCPPDAFNSGEDLVVLPPGGSHSLTYRIYAEEG